MYQDWMEKVPICEDIQWGERKMSEKIDELERRIRDLKIKNI